MARSLLSAVFSVSLSKGTQIVVGILFTPILVRLLGPSEYGRYAIVLSVYGIVNIFMSSGTNDAVRKYISEREDDDWQQAVFGYIFRPAIILGLLTASAFTLVASTGIAESIFGDGFDRLFYLLAGFVLGRQLRQFVRRTLMGLQLESKSEPLVIVQKILFSILALILVYTGFGVGGVLIADIITSIVITIAGGLILSRHLPLLAIVSRSTIVLPKRQIATYIGNTTLFFLFLTSLYHIDILLLQQWASDETVGHYQGALQIAEVLWLAPTAVQMSLLQRVSQHWEDGDIDAIQKQSEIVTRYVVLFTALLAIGVGALAQDFVPLYLGDDFSPAILPVLLLLPGTLGFAAARPTLAINQARRSLRPLITATAGCSILNVMLNLALIPRYGMLGAAIATSIGYLSLVIFQTLAAKKLGYNPFAGLRIVRSTITCALSLIVIVSVALSISSQWLSLIMVPPFGFVVFTLLTVVTGAIQIEEIEQVTSVLPNSLGQLLIKVIQRIPTMD